MTGLHVACGHSFDGGFTLDAQFEAPPGVTALFGPSGSGKTTVLEIIAGVRRPQRGKIQLGEKCFFDDHTHVELPSQQRGVGLVPQDDLLFPHLSVRQNLQFGVRYSKQARPEFEHVVAVLRLEGLLDRRPSTLSGGERQRVALGRAVLRGPDVLLMDEPINAQDEALKHRLIQDLCAMVAELSIVAIFVSHDQNDVRRFADRVVLLDRGRVVGAGPAAATLDATVKSHAAGIDTPTNLVRICEIHAEQGAWIGALGENRAVLPAGQYPPGGAIYVSFQPADVLLSREDVGGLSVRNHWRGRIIDIVTSAGHVFIHLDVGQPIWAEITPQAQQSLAFRPGDSVICLVKTSALRPLQTT